MEQTHLKKPTRLDSVFIRKCVTYKIVGHVTLAIWQLQTTSLYSLYKSTKKQNLSSNTDQVRLITYSGKNVLYILLKKQPYTYTVYCIPDLFP